MNNIPHSIDPKQVDQVVNKWRKVLDYTGGSVREIQNEHIYKTTAILLENQEQWCMREANGASSGGIFGAGTSIGTSGPGVSPNQDNYATGDARLPKILIPMIRRTFPELISNEICGVQPMGGPVGLAFALRYAYQDTALNGYDEVGSATALRGVGGSSSPSRGSIGYGGNTSLPSVPLTPSTNYSPELGYQLLDTRFTGASSGSLSGDGVNWSFAAQDQGVAALLANYENTGRIPQIEMKFDKTSVEAGTRRLGTKWSIELEQDLKTMQGIDIDSELTNAMSYEIQAEIDREVLMRMIQVAFNAGFGNGFSFWSPASADGRWTGERNITFYQKLIVEAGRMAARNRRGPANFVIATPRVCSILEMLPDFKIYEISGTVSTAGVGVSKVGTVGGRFTIYRDTRTEVQNQTLYGTQGYSGQTQGVEYALMGYKGSEYYDTGIIYCPYIPVMVQRAVDPVSFTPRVALMTRYGVVNNIFGASLYYHLIIVKDLGLAFTPGSVSVYL